MAIQLYRMVETYESLSANTGDPWLAFRQYLQSETASKHAVACGISAFIVQASYIYICFLLIVT